MAHKFLTFSSLLRKGGEFQQVNKQPKIIELITVRVIFHCKLVHGLPNFYYCVCYQCLISFHIDQRDDSPDFHSQGLAFVCVCVCVCVYIYFYVVCLGHTTLHVVYQFLVLLYLVAESCLALCDCLYCSPPSSSVHGIFQARILKLVAFSSSRNLRDQRIKPASPAVKGDSVALHQRGSLLDP